MTQQKQEDNQMLAQLTQERSAMSKVIANLEVRIVDEWKKEGEPFIDRFHEIEEQLGGDYPAKLTAALFWVINGANSLEDNRKMVLYQSYMNLFRLYGAREFLSMFLKRHGIRVTDKVPYIRPLDTGGDVN